MDSMYNSLCITSMASTITSIMGIDGSSEFCHPIDVLMKKAQKQFKNEKADRVFLYNPDAVAMWLFQKYTNMFEKALSCSDISLPMLSVMPSVTPVCFASMYSGVNPDVHGIQTYVKPVLTVKTVFDMLIQAGKKIALVSTSNDSISMIFLERKMDYYIFDSVKDVNQKAFELIEKDEYDLIVVYNGNYDSTMHKFGPESKEAMEELKSNIDFYENAANKIKKHWITHNTFLGFMPDHGCHEIDGNCGSHGLDMTEDMNIIHFYAFNSRA